jgi:hypothetical protein
MAGELRKTIFEADDIESEIVEIPQWGVKIEVRGMTSKERAKLLKSTSVNGEVDFDRWFPDLIIATAHDPETGEKVFEAADRDMLNTKSGAAITRLAETASRLSGLGEADVDAAKEDLQA